MQFGANDYKTTYGDSVTDDVHYLAELGLIEIKKTKNGRKKTRPVVDYEKIQVEIMV